MGIDDLAESELLPQNKSLSNKALPENWPQFPTLEEESDAYQILYDPEDDHFKPPVHKSIDRLSYELAGQGKRLLFLALDHSKDPTNPQFDSLERQFKSFQPQAFLIEAEEAIPASALINKSREEVIRTFGEVGFICWMVYKNNESSAPKSILKGCDIPFGKWVAEFKKRGYTNEQIMTLDIVRDIYYHLQLAKAQNKGLDQEEKEFIENFKRLYESPSQPDRIKQKLALLRKKDGSDWTWESFKQQYAQETGKKFAFPDVNSATDLPRMFNDEREFRDGFVLNVIVDVLKTNDKAIIAMGSAHAIREQKTLEQYFQSQATSPQPH